MPDFGEKPELYALRQEWAIKHATLNDRHSAAIDELHNSFRDVLAARGLSDKEIEREVWAMIRDATPIPREYGAGIEDDDSFGHGSGTDAA